MLLKRQRYATRTRQLFSDPPPFLTVTHSINGGRHLNIWWRNTESAGPELWVHAPAMMTIDSSGRSDPTREGMAHAGLQEGTQGDPVLPAEGWSALLEGDAIHITDADGTSWVEVEDIPGEIVTSIETWAGVTLVYGDLPITQPTDSRLSGWVHVAGSGRKPQSEHDHA